MLALTRADMVDEELKRLRADEVPSDLPSIYISAVTGEGMTALKDLLYEMIISNRENYDGLQQSMEEE